MLESLLRRELLTEDGTQAISAKLDVQKLKQALSAQDWCLLEGKYISMDIPTKNWDMG